MMTTEPINSNIEACLLANFIRKLYLDLQEIRMAFRCIKIGSSSLRTQQNKCFTVMQRLLSQFTPSQSSVAFPESIVHLGSGLPIKLVL